MLDYCNFRFFYACVLDPIGSIFVIFCLEMLPGHCLSPVGVL